MLVIYPTETCYGLGCSAFNKEEVKKVYELKQRPKTKPLIVLVDSIKMWKSIAQVSPEAVKLAEEYWPGALTIIQPKKSRIPDMVAEKEGGVRWSPHPAPNKLIKTLHAPIISTSANTSGGKNPYSVKDIPLSIREGVDKIIDVGELPENPPSTVVRVNDEIEVLRQGKIRL